MKKERNRIEVLTSQNQIRRIKLAPVDQLKGVSWLKIRRLSSALGQFAVLYVHAS